VIIITSSYSIFLLFSNCDTLISSFTALCLITVGILHRSSAIERWRR